MMFYTGDQFPAELKGNVFAAEHGSWNRATRTGYKVIRAIMQDGVPTGEYEDFVTGFVIDDSSVWGRPVGVAQAKDGVAAGHRGRQRHASGASAARAARRRTEGIRRPSATRRSPRICDLPRRL